MSERKLINILSHYVSEVRIMLKDLAAKLEDLEEELIKFKEDLRRMRSNG